MAVNEREKDSRGREIGLARKIFTFNSSSSSRALIRFPQSDLSAIMTTSRRFADRKVDRFEKNITKRGAVTETTAKKGKDYPVGPILIGFFIFVVIGSSLFQIIRTATTGGMA
ncbi:uncharacterized protein J3R85_011405 [Psidium guajava]|nr:uncharacterized protein J3R85_011405 [Psidium guajava]